MLNALGVLEVVLGNVEALVDLALDGLRRVGGGLDEATGLVGLCEQGARQRAIVAFRDGGRDVLGSTKEGDVGLGDLGLSEGGNGS